MEKERMIEYWYVDAYGNQRVNYHFTCWREIVRPDLWMRYEKDYLSFFIGKMDTKAVTDFVKNMAKKFLELWLEFKKEKDE